MRLIGKKKLEKLRRKNKGNDSLSEAIDQLVKDIEENDWKNQVELGKIERMLTACIVRVFISLIFQFTE